MNKYLKGNKKNYKKYQDQNQGKEKEQGKRKGISSPVFCLVSSGFFVLLFVFVLTPLVGGAPTLSSQSASFASPLPPEPFKTGLNYFYQGEYDKAIAELEKSIELDKDHAESYYYLGQCYLQKGITEYNKKNIFKANSLFRKANEVAEQAIPLYQKNIEENPTVLDSYLKLAYIYELRSEVPFNDETDIALDYYLQALEVIAQLELELELEEANANSSYSSSAPSGSSGSPSRYRPNYKGTKVSVNLHIGYLYFKQKKYAEAIEYLAEAEKLSPRNIEVNYYLGLSYDRIGEKEKAISFLSRVVELAPDSEYARKAKKKIEEIE